MKDNLMKSSSIAPLVASLLIVSGATQANDATYCVAVKPDRLGNQIIFNRCTTTIHAVWCVSNYNQSYECTKYNNGANLGPSGETHVGEVGVVRFAACAGANSVHGFGQEISKIRCKP